jgi:hypothetical protein
MNRAFSEGIYNNSTRYDIDFWGYALHWHLSTLFLKFLHLHLPSGIRRRLAYGFGAT